MGGVMFGLFKKKDKEKDDVEALQEVIRDYGLCMENFPEAGMVVYDEIFLPHSKMIIREALIKGYKLTNNETLMVGMENLGWFQKNIGEIPLRGFPDYSNMSPEQVIQSSKKTDKDSNINQIKHKEISLVAEKEYAEILKLL